VVSRGRGAWSSSPTSSLLLVLLVALVLVPSANFALFSGIPLASGAEFIAALLLLPLVLSATARKCWRQLLGMARGSWLVRVVALVAVLAFVAKVILFVSGAHTGFLACYRSLSSTPVRGCEHSYADPLSRFGSTRSDRTIDFGTQGFDLGDFSSVGANLWNLDFFNSLRFNRQRRVPYRNFLPFLVRWTGDISGPAWHGLVVRYVGEGGIRVDKRRIVLPPSYQTAAKRSFGVPPGRHAIVVEYRFARKVLQPRPLAGPYAQIAIHGADGTVLRPAPLAIGWRLVAIFSDAITIALLAVAGLAFLTVLRGRVLLAGACAALAALALELPHGAATLGFLEWALFMLVVWSLARRRWSTGTALLTAYFCLVAIELVRAHHDFQPFDQVSYPTRGNDPLTYESQAHEVLAGSLRGGESTFVYSPAFRYVLAGGHALFGNGDARLSLVALLALTFAVFAFGVACVLGYPHSPRQGTWNWSVARSQVVWKAGACIAGGATLLLVTNPLVVQMVRNPQSEFPTWILVAVALFLSLHLRRRPAFLVAALLAGVALTTRFDEGIGLIFLLLCGAAALWPRERPDARSWRVAVIAAVVVFAAIALLPAIHNLHYGGKFVVLPQTPRTPVNFPLPPARLIRVCCDASVRATLIDQLKGVTVRDVPASSGVTAGFEIVVALLQLLWVASLVGLGLNWRRSNPTMRLVAALPLAFLVPFIFLQVYVYYPRHVVVGYLVMGLAAAFVMGELGRNLGLPPLPAPQRRRWMSRCAALRGRRRTPDSPVTKAASTSTTP
jgi:hypothetical protein